MSHCFDIGSSNIQRYVCVLLMLAPVQLIADVVRDGTIGPDKTSQPIGPNYDIGEQFGELRGGNLFHSFEEFGLTNEQSATFSGASSISAIISRVTGPNASSIDGLLRSTVPGAALYLMNPHGIVFGSNAKLDIPGAFHASTAQTLQFSSGETFGTDVANDPVLTTAAPEAFGFLGANAATIELNGSVFESMSGIELSAGNIEFKDGAEITTLASEEERGGDIKLIAIGDIELSGGNSEGWGVRLVASSIGRNPSGSIEIYGSNVEFSDGAIGAIQNEGAGESGDLNVTATESLTLSGANNRGMGSRIQVGTLGTGSAGNIRIVAPNIQLKDGSVIGTYSANSGSSGDLELTATQRLTMAGIDSVGLGSRLGSVGLASGKAGSLRIDAPLVELNDGAFMTSHTESTGNGGDLIVSVAERLTFTGVDGDGRGSRLIAATKGEGSAGILQVTAPIIELNDGAEFTTETQSQGKAGDLLVTASERIVISGVGANGRPSNLRTGAWSDGQAGSLMVVAPTVVLDGGAYITTETNGLGNGGELVIKAADSLVLKGVSPAGRGSTLKAISAGSGNAGNLRVDATTVDLRDGAVITTTAAGSGAGGLLTVNARERLTLSGADGNGDGAKLHASTILGATGGDIQINSPFISLTNNSAIESRSTSGLQGAGNAGHITIIADQLQLLDHSTVSTEAERASGGNIVIDVDSLVNLRDSSIVTNVNSGDGRGGNITINPEVVVLNRSSITARADAGAGGRIAIEAGQLFSSPDSIINASSQSGIDGEIAGADPDTRLASDLAHTSLEFLDATGLLRPSCDAGEAPDQAGRFDAVSRTGLPLSPEDFLMAFDSDERDIEFDTNVDIDAVLDSVDSEDRKSSEIVNGVEDAPVQALRVAAHDQQTRGNYGASLPALHAALTKAQAAENGSGVAAALGQVGNTYLALGETKAAEKLLLQAIERSPDDAGQRAALFNNLGNLYSVKRQHNEALSAYRTSAIEARVAGNDVHSAQALSNATRSAIALRDFEQGSVLFDEAQAAATGLADTHVKAEILIHIAKSALLLSTSNPRMRDSVLSVAYADLRQAAYISGELDDALSLSYALGNMGRLYQQQQRIEEALYLTHLAQQAAERANAPESRYRWHWQAGQLLWSQGNIDLALQAYRQAVSIVDAVRPETQAQYGDAQLRFRELVAPVYLDLVNGLLQHATYSAESDVEFLLREAQVTMEQLKAAELRDYFRDECVAELTAKSTRLEEVSHSAAVAYPILLPDRLELLVSLPSGLKRYTVPVSAETVENAVQAFRFRVETLASEHQVRAVGYQLYRWLVAPFVADLDGVDTLVFVPGGALRTIPLAALHDGTDYLIRSYRIVVTPGLALTDPQPFNREDPVFVLAGVSEAVQNFPALPAVPRELAAVEQLYPGRVLLDKAFTLASFEQAITGPVSVVHIASHAQFTGNLDSSFLLTHDERLSLIDFEKMLSVTRFRKRPLELLVLSACQTAVGDERAALGLAGVGIRAGARSALGSLWAISDDATALLITDFYRNLKTPGVSRARALQAAQQSMLDETSFTHPFYWSGFLLINNWL